MPYSLEWGDVTLELKIIWHEDQGDVDPIYSSEYLPYFALIPGTFMNQYWWILIPIGLVVLAGITIPTVLYFTKWR